MSRPCVMARPINFLSSSIHTDGGGGGSGGGEGGERGRRGDQADLLVSLHVGQAWYVLHSHSVCFCFGTAMDLTNSHTHIHQHTNAPGRITSLGRSSHHGPTTSTRPISIKPLHQPRLLQSRTRTVWCRSAPLLLPFPYLLQPAAEAEVATLGGFQALWAALPFGQVNGWVHDRCNIQTF